jgi:hypothetical protein
LRRGERGRGWQGVGEQNTDLRASAAQKIQV